MVQEVIAMYDSGKVRFGQAAEEDSSLIHVTRISALTNTIMFKYEDLNQLKI